MHVVDWTRIGSGPLQTVCTSLICWGIYSEVGTCHLWKIKRKDIKDIIEQLHFRWWCKPLKLLYYLLCVQPKKNATAQSLYQVRCKHVCTNACVCWCTVCVGVHTHTRIRTPTLRIHTRTCTHTRTSFKSFTHFFWPCRWLMIQKLLHQVVAQELAPEDGTEMYFIFVEQLVLCKAQSLERAGYLFLIWNTLKRFAYLFYLACPTMPSQKPLRFSHSHTLR